MARPCIKETCSSIPISQDPATQKQIKSILIIEEIKNKLNELSDEAKVLLSKAYPDICKLTWTKKKE